MPNQCSTRTPNLSYNSGPQTTLQNAPQRQPAGNQARQEELFHPSVPTATLNFDDLAEAIFPPAMSGNSLVTASCKLGGSLSATPVGQDSPIGVSPNGVTAGGPGGGVGMGNNGDPSVRLQSALEGITQSAELHIQDSGASLSLGAAGEFGSVLVETDGTTMTFVCAPTPVEVEVGDVRISGSVSYTLKVTSIPQGPRPSPVPIPGSSFPWLALGLTLVTAIAIGAALTLPPLDVLAIPGLAAASAAGS